LSYGCSSSRAAHHGPKRVRLQGQREGELQIHYFWVRPNDQ